MILHAENDKQKKTISMHICTGMVCKNCLHFSKSTVLPDTGYCYNWNKAGLSYNDFCSLFRMRVKNDS